MATLSGFGISLLAGTCTLTISLISFGFAIRAGYNNQIAPRTWARPKSVIKNAITGHNNKTKQTNKDRVNDRRGGGNGSGGTFSYWYLQLVKFFNRN